jgi:hypothetical protein
MPNREAAERRLEKLFTAVAAWAARIEQPPLLASPGSSLATDDQAFPHLPASAIAYNGLVTAVEHLDYFRTALQATGRIYPAANYTPLRSALMGATQAVWVLAPEVADERVGHALDIAVDTYNQQRKLVEAATALTVEQQAVADRVIATLEARLAEAAAVATTLGKNPANIRRSKLDMTRTITEAVELVNPSDTADAAVIRSGTGLLWRSQSGHAHGTPGSRLSLIDRDSVVDGRNGTLWGRREHLLRGNRHRHRGRHVAAQPCLASLRPTSSEPRQRVMTANDQPPDPAAKIRDDEASARTAKSAIMILIDAFDTVLDAGKITLIAENSHVFQAMFGWWAWIVRSSKVVVLLHDNGLNHEAAPTVRSILQHALVLQWVVDVGDQALEAVAEHGDNERRKLLGHAQRAGWSLPKDIDATIPPKPETAHPLLPLASTFAKLCRAYDAQTAYVAFSLLSAHVHPTAQGAMAYIDHQTGLQGTPTCESFSGLIHTAACAIQTAKTINRLLTEQPFDEAITRAEQALGTRIDLPVLRPEQRRRQS